MEIDSGMLTLISRPGSEGGEWAFAAARPETGRTQKETAPGTSRLPLVSSGVSRFSWAKDLPHATGAKDLGNQGVGCLEIFFFINFYLGIFLKVLTSYYFKRFNYLIIASKILIYQWEIENKYLNNI